MNSQAMNTTTTARTLTCNECGFTSADAHLVLNHSCDVEENGGQCEDWPCCGHERGDCNGRLYGSDESIKNDPHLLCDHENGQCELADQYDYEDDEDDDDQDHPNN